MNTVPENGKALLFIHASWCGPCQRTKPGIEAIAEREAANPDGLAVVMIDGDEDLDAAMTYKLTTYPLVALFVDGKEVARRGSGTQEEIEDWIAETLN